MTWEFLFPCDPCDGSAAYILLQRSWCSALGSFVYYKSMIDMCLDNIERLTGFQLKVDCMYIDEIFK